MVPSEADACGVARPTWDHYLGVSGRPSGRRWRKVACGRYGGRGGLYSVVGCMAMYGCMVYGCCMAVCAVLRYNGRGTGRVRCIAIYTAIQHVFPYSHPYSTKHCDAHGDHGGDGHMVA